MSLRIELVPVIPIRIPQNLYHLTMLLVFIQYGLQLLPNIMPHDAVYF